MIKRTLYFGNPAYLSLKNKQLIIRLPEVEKNESLPASFKREASGSVPIEDLGFVILDHQQLVLTHALMMSLMANHVTIISCNSSHMPDGLMLPQETHSIQTARTRAQLEASEPLKKNLWQQTVQAKIANQKLLLAAEGVPIENMSYWQKNVKSGDTENHEGRASAYYWANIFGMIPDFKRSREGSPPNNLLNYGYAILRAVVARALVSAGLHLVLGIHHRNKYNSYCLADDLMEPYRPVVDKLVLAILKGMQHKDYFEPEDFELTTELKKQFLMIPAMDVYIESIKSPLMVAAQRTAASLIRCFEGSSRKLILPVIS
ncbi:MAG: type II CRISPR-associated endonuclease Cas1 [Lentimicrobium sp.]|jgi:CRISPR-associated protein Cas1|nr:type II CRISPR-associated endonuclease Cas1 [Lentimicrobium sp.]